MSRREEYVRPVRPPEMSRFGITKGDVTESPIKKRPAKTKTLEPRVPVGEPELFRQRREKKLRDDWDDGKLKLRFREGGMVEADAPRGKKFSGTY